MATEPIKQVLARTRVIAAETRAKLASMAVRSHRPGPVAGSVAEAHTLAERHQRPVQAEWRGFPVSVFPVGQAPPYFGVSRDE